MNCKSVQIYLSAYLDGELRGPESLQVREHLSACSECRAEELQLRALKQMLQGLPTYTPAQDFEDRLVANVMRRAEKRRSIFTFNLNWRVTGALVGAASIAAFGMFRLLRGMAALPVPGLEDGGILWFQDLTMPDPFYILPVASAAVMYYIMKVRLLPLVFSFFWPLSMPLFLVPFPS